MISPLITCSICGYVFDPTLHATCQACPLQKGCNLVCCPQCGFEMVDIRQSRLARIFSHLLPKTKENPAAGISHLAAISPGKQARVVAFGSSIPADRQAYLQSYGLIPGRMVRVIQHSPVTIIRVEHTELAMERDMARQIQVEVT